MSPVHHAADRSHLAAHPRFPRASGYHPDWVFGNNMGPNALWLMEWLTQVVPLQPDSRALDMGCGKGITSVFLAEQFDVKVVANDLWIKPTDNWGRFVEAGCADAIVPIHAEAHSLPYADGYFDCLLSVDAYHYFGTADLYLDYYARFVRPGGTIGIVVPGLYQEIEEVPDRLSELRDETGKPFWDWDFCSFHSADWWARLWRRTPRVTSVRADTMEQGGDVFLASEVAKERHFGIEAESVFVQGLREDADRNLTFVRVVAQRAESD
ncbi:MAG: methyltransferase domain-containing protein [Spirochaetaceae bacterium]|nr:methyltransferase domain-containing protein [Spirochaetaceae bacterium]